MRNDHGNGAWFIAVGCAMPVVYFVLRRVGRIAFKRALLGYLTFEAIRFAFYIYYLWGWLWVY